MSDTVSRFLSTVLPPLASPTTGALIVPGIAELTTLALQAHNESEAAALSAVLKAQDCGKALNEIKKQLPHGSFEEFVAAHFPFTIRTAQSYMRLAKRETEVQQLVEAKAKLGSHLTIKEALKYLNTVCGKKRR